MSEKQSAVDRVLRAVYGEPKFKAQVEWISEYGFSAQLARQIPRDEQEHYATTGTWPNPDRPVQIMEYEMPDFDWWEPRHDQPWRRINTRYREMGVA